jgi:hypothetical protein
MIAEDLNSDGYMTTEDGELHYPGLDEIGNVACASGEPHPGSPSSPTYWKNIIPEEYLLSNREGIDTVEGEITEIDEESPQSWNPGPNDEIYYYPVLPKLNKFGKLDYEKLGLQNNGNNIPFGSPNREWDKDDETALITNLDIQDPDFLIDLDFSSISDGVLYDNSGNENIGVLINDYKVGLDNNRLSRIKFPTEPKLEKNPKEKAF